MKLSTFLSKFTDVIEERDGWVVPCPAHNDSSPSMRVALNESNAMLLHCRAGCTKHNVLAAINAMGIPSSQLFDIHNDEGDIRKVGDTQSSGPTPTMVALTRGYIMSCNQRLLNDQSPGAQAARQ